jgi:hypothetical protein
VALRAQDLQHMRFATQGSQHMGCGTKGSGLTTHEVRRSGLTTRGVALRARDSQHMSYGTHRTFNSFIISVVYLKVHSGHGCLCKVIYIVGMGASVE